MSLRSRLAVVAAVLLTVLAVAGSLLARAVDSSQLQLADQQLASVVQAMGRLGVGTGQALEPAKVGAAQDALSGTYVATLSGGARHVVIAPSGSSYGTPRAPTVVVPARSSWRHASTVGPLSGTGRWRAVLVRPPGSSVELLMAVSLSGIDVTLRLVLLAVLATAALVVVVMAAGGLWVSRLGLRPIAEVTEVADAIVAGDRSRRVAAARSRTEAGRLARAFNLMLDEQQALEVRLRQFIADASHELRSPVTAIKGFTDLWRRGSLRQGPALEDAMRRIGQESARMGRLVEDLLTLARLDEGRPLQREPVDVTTVARDAVVEASASHPSRPISLEADGPVVVTGDADALRQVVDNLVGNALSHTRSPVTVSVAGNHCVAELVVSDTRPGMSADGVAHAFDRFWQADPSRAGSGSGLGLSIVAAIVAAHQGSVAIDSQPVAGTKVLVTLPLLRLSSPGPAEPAI